MGMERREGWREALPLRTAIDRLFEDAVVRLGGAAGREVPLDLGESDEAFEVRVALPGVRPEDVRLTVEHQALTIEGEWAREQTRGDQRWHLRERAQGRFARTLRLPAPVDAERVTAQLAHGVLTVHLPKAPAAQPRRIPVRGQPAGGPAALDTGPGGTAISHGQPAASAQPVAGTQPTDPDRVTQESIDSFPASDPPSYTPERL
ncbi:MAG TPA: Hsp20/alpha crystallin family protein [Chloroflexota bacterium]|jgi:HSP20 family protein|nr:Hsp20/alpha crystallin family protein [Chloroflexota bacterium]